jgi:uncharacterized protein (DUF302 family)
MLYKEISQKSVQTIVEDIQNLVPDYKFGVLHIHNIKETLQKKGFEFEKECQILDICNPTIAQNILNIDMSISTIMPCKISVYEENNQTIIAMNSFTELIKEFNKELVETAKNTQETLLKIMKEVK